MKQLNKKDKAETEHACKEIIFTLILMMMTMMMTMMMMMTMIMKMTMMITMMTTMMIMMLTKWLKVSLLVMSYTSKAPAAPLCSRQG